MITLSIGGLLMASAVAWAPVEDSLDKIQADLSKTMRQSEEGLSESDLVSLSDRCFQVAEADPDNAFQALNLATTIAGLSPTDLSAEVYGEAGDRIVENFLNDDRLGNFLFGLRRAPMGTEDKVTEWLEWVYAESENKMLKGGSLYVQALLIKNQGDDLTDKDRARAVAMLEKVQQEYGQIKSPLGPFGEVSKGLITELKHLYIGATAPEIQNEDLDGVEFKLSDYRGKVVVLDFWGDW